MPPNAQVGEYRLLDVIGEGGFGIVYRAQDLSLDRVVAIKEYLPATMASRSASSGVHVRSQHRGAFDAGLRSFINEARLLAKFSHPALVQVYRFFEGNGTAYMVMCCYEGQTLRAFLESQPKDLDERWLKATLCPLLDVLEMLHSADCYHRDIAPDNVFLQRSGMPVMLDFGAARRIISDMTQALTMVLKPGFAPIEQYAEDGTMPQGAWTDIYQLGALLYQVITGKTPTTAVARMINDPIKQLTSEQYPAYSTEFLAGVHRALAVKPQDRPQSITELKSLLGISDFSNSSFSRFSSGLALPDFSPSGRAPLFAETVRDQPFQVTTPTPTPVQPAPELIDTAKDALLSLLDKAPAPRSSPAPTSAVAPAQAPAAAGGLNRQRRGKTSTAQKTGASVKTNKTNKTNKTSRTSKLWAGIALTVALLGGALHWSMDAEAPSAQISEDAHWAAVLAAPSTTSLKAYLDAYPSGIHQADAKQRLEMIEKNMGSPAVEPETTQSVAAASDPNATATTTAVTTAEIEAARIEPQPESEPVAMPPPMEAPPAPPTETTPPPEEVVEVVRGKVVLRVTPWGRIYVDRTAMGMTPPRMELNLPVGHHRIRVTNPAAPPMVWDIQLTRDEPVVLTHHFAKTPPMETPPKNTPPKDTPPIEAPTGNL